MEDLSLDEITKRIIDVVLEENILDRDFLNERIRPILKIWLKVADKPRRFKENKATPSKLQQTINQRGMEREFWREKIIKIKGKNNMEELYAELTELMKKEGYLTI